MIRYGDTRRWVAGLTVVTGAGELLPLNRGLTKNNAGYDLRHLFIGSEGTLGIIVEADIQLSDPPPATRVLLLAVNDSEGLLKLMAQARQSLALTAFEFFCAKAMKAVERHCGVASPLGVAPPFYALIEFECPDVQAEEAATAFFAPKP